MGIVEVPTTHAKSCVMMFLRSVVLRDPIAAIISNNKDSATDDGEPN
jgi:hypothetical protein